MEKVRKPMAKKSVSQYLILISVFCMGVSRKKEELNYYQDR